MKPRRFITFAIYLTASLTVRTEPLERNRPQQRKKNDVAEDYVRTVRGPYCQLDVGLCEVDVFLHWNGAEEGAWVGLKRDLQGRTGVNLLRVQFWSLFDPFIVANLLRRLFQVEADLTSNSCGWNLELGRPIFARLLFLTF